MSSHPSSFIWYDIMTPDIDAAEAFYASVVGWTIADSGMPDRSYRILSAGQTMVGGMMPVPPEMGGAEPMWFGYVWVADVDASAARLADAGGEVKRGPMDIPGIGRFAVVSDPDGAPFILFKPNSTDAAEKPPVGTPGQIGWHELNAGALERAWPFYSTLFGWGQAGELDMGGSGVYRMFTPRGDNPADMIGGMMTKGPDMPAPRWRYYFNVEAIDAAIERVKLGGGVVSSGPHQVPGGSWVAMCSDPQGAIFGMSAPRR